MPDQDSGVSRLGAPLVEQSLELLMVLAGMAWLYSTWIDGVQRHIGGVRERVDRLHHGRRVGQRSGRCELSGEVAKVVSVNSCAVEFRKT